MSNTATNPTAQLLIDRLPATPTVSPDDIAAALGLRSTRSVITAISVGRLGACIVGGRYIIARAEAARWITSTAVTPDEAE